MRLNIWRCGFKGFMHVKLEYWFALMAHGSMRESMFYTYICTVLVDLTAWHNAQMSAFGYKDWRLGILDSSHSRATPTYKCGSPYFFSLSSFAPFISSYDSVFHAHVYITISSSAYDCRPYSLAYAYAPYWFSISNTLPTFFCHSPLL